MAQGGSHRIGGDSEGWDGGLGLACGAQSGQRIGPSLRDCSDLLTASSPQPELLSHEWDGECVHTIQKRLQNALTAKNKKAAAQDVD